MIKDIKRMFGRLIPLEVATNELIEAELEKLEAETAQEYAKMLCLYNEARIKRLRAFIKESTNGQNPRPKRESVPPLDHTGPSGPGQA